MGIVVCAAAGAGCFDGLKNRSDATAPGTGIKATAEAVTTAAAELASLTIPQGSVGVRDFSQSSFAMSSLTEVDYRNGNVQNTFNSVNRLLPTTNDIATVSGPTIIALSKLGATYCDEITAAADARRAAVFPGINFGANTPVITTAMRDTVVKSLLSRFTREANPPEAELTEMKSLFDELKAALPTNSTAGTRGLMVGVCTAALGTAKSVLVY